MLHKLCTVTHFENNNSNLKSQMASTQNTKSLPDWKLKLTS